MAFAVDATNSFGNFIDGDFTKTLPVTISATAGRAAAALVWTTSGTDAGTGMTLGGNAMTAMTPGTDVFGVGFRGYHISGDANIPTGSQNFVLTALSQIIARIVVVVVNGLESTASIIGTPQYSNATSATPTASGHASWTGDMAFAIALGSTASTNTITAGASTTLDFGGSPASPQAFAGHRSGGNVAVNFNSSSSDEFVLLGLSLDQPGGGDVEAALTGVQHTVAQGSMTPSHTVPIREMLRQKFISLPGSSLLVPSWLASRRRFA